jgi:hypothetical protein
VSFYLSHDQRFLLKEVKHAEYEWILKDVEALFWYTDQVLFDKLPSVMAQVVGLFTVDVRKHHRTKSKARHWIVQRNLRFSLQGRPHVCFDLKGLGTSRRAPKGPEIPVQHENTMGLGATVAGQPPNMDVPETSSAAGGSDKPGGDRQEKSEIKKRSKDSKQQDNEKEVLWDQNFREWREGKPLCLLSPQLKYLEAALWNDSQFLSKNSLIDYSLLLAADDEKSTDSPNEPRQLSVGIIDYLRPFDIVKKIENTWKSAVNQGEMPTVVPPSDYRERFLRAMGTFFVAEAAPSSS